LNYETTVYCVFPKRAYTTQKLILGSLGYDKIRFCLSPLFSEILARPAVNLLLKLLYVQVFMWHI